MEFSTNFALAAEAPTNIPTGLVCALGISVVFVGLICIIAILYLMNWIIEKADGKKTDKVDATATTAVSAPAAKIENRREIIAAVCAAVAEEEGTDISAIRVISFKKL